MVSSSPISNSIFEIAPGVKNTDWQALNLTPESVKDDWEKAVEMFSKRIARFLVPVKALMNSTDIETALFSGFAIMALDCLLIETIQSFKAGRLNQERGNDGQSKKMIVDFLTQSSLFKTYFAVRAKAELFCNHFRNGILHQGEVKSSGRIRIDTQEMIMPSDDDQSFIVNRWKFHKALTEEIENYATELINGNDVELRKNFIKKMNEISRL